MNKVLWGLINPFRGGAMDQIQAMRIFTRVVEAGTFTRAADSLSLPKATVTKINRVDADDAGILARLKAEGA
eukprot:gene1720-2267_t